MSRGWQWQRARLARSLAIGAALAVLGAASAHAADPIKIGHVAALSGASAQSGEAITRGFALAIDEINAKGGLLGGRMLELVQRDDELNPPKGLIAARELISARRWWRSSAASTRRCRWPWCRCSTRRSAYMGVWAAGTGITRNGATPNYAFRVSAVDVLVDVRLLDYAHKKFGAKKAGLMLINNPWGQSNETGPGGGEQGRPVDRDRRHREIREQRCRHGPAIGAAQGGRRRRHHPRRQCTARRAGDEVARAHGLDGAGGVALGHFRRALPRARRSDRRRSAFRADLQLLRQAEADRPACAGGPHEEVSADQGPGDVFAPVGTANAYDAMHLMALASTRPARPTRMDPHGARRPEDALRRPDQDLRAAVHGGKP